MRTGQTNVHEMGGWVQERLKPSDGNEKRGMRNRAGQLPGPGKREQVPGKREGGQG